MISGPPPSTPKPPPLVDAGSITWLDDYPPMPSPYRHKRFLAPPTAIVVHSGDVGAGVAEYLARSDSRQVSAHFAWSQKHRGLVQMIPLELEAMHGGCGTRAKCPFFRARSCASMGLIDGRGINRCSYGIELPGPAGHKRGEEEMSQLEALIAELMRRAPITLIAAHSALCRLRHDPGPGLDWARLEKFGTRLMR